MPPSIPYTAADVDAFAKQIGASAGGALTRANRIALVQMLAWGDATAAMAGLAEALAAAAKTDAQALGDLARAVAPVAGQAGTGGGA